jgi:hypothetical protein
VAGEQQAQLSSASDSMPEIQAIALGSPTRSTSAILFFEFWDRFERLLLQD